MTRRRVEIIAGATAVMVSSWGLAGAGRGTGDTSAERRLPNRSNAYVMLGKSTPFSLAAPETPGQLLRRTRVRRRLPWPKYGYATSRERSRLSSKKEPDR